VPHVVLGVDWQPWGEWFNKIKGKAHELGVELNLRSDDPKEYNNESDYFYVNVADRLEGSDEVKVLNLDHLVHSYFNPQKPNELYYEYEKVYAAVTERATEMWNRETVIDLPALPKGGAELPAWTKYNSAARTLAVQGSISGQKRLDLMKLSPSGPY